MNKFLILLALILSVSSCAPAVPIVPPIKASTATIAPTITPSATSSPTSTPTITSSPQPLVLVGKFIDSGYTPDMKKLIIGTTSSISYYDTELETVIWSKETPIVQGKIMKVSNVFKVRISNSEKYLAVATPTGIEIWDANNGSVIRELEGLSRPISPTRDFRSPDEIGIRKLVFSPDDKYLGVQVNDGIATNDYSIYIWDIMLGELLPALSGESFSFSPDSSLAAISAEDRTTIRIYKVVDWSVLYTLTLPKAAFGIPTALIFSPNSSLFISAQDYGGTEIFVWSMANGEVIRKTPISSYRYLTFINDNLVGIADRSGNRMIDVNTGQQTKLPGELMLSSGSYKVFDTIFDYSDNSEVIALGILRSRTDYEEIQIWDINQNKILLKLPIEDTIFTCQFSDDLNYLSCLLPRKFITR